MHGNWGLLRHQMLDFAPPHRRQVLGDQHSMALLGALFRAQKANWPRDVHEPRRAGRPPLQAGRVPLPPVIVIQEHVAKFGKRPVTDAGLTQQSLDSFVGSLRFHVSARIPGRA